jgi:hypothetical protein
MQDEKIKNMGETRDRFSISEISSDIIKALHKIL